MRLKNIRLFNFKNYQECNLDFHDEINVIIGSNGSGKTNLLDAIHYLSMTKSTFSISDSASVQKETDFFAIKGQFNYQKQDRIVLCNFKKGGKKSMQIDGKEYDRLSDHIGLIPLVIIAPDDTDLVREGSEIRRKFFDIILSQFSKDYLLALMSYNRYLKQRNALLKNYWNKLTPKSEIFAPYDHELIKLSKKIYHFRHDFLEGYLTSFKSFYEKMSGTSEIPNIIYRSQVASDSFEHDYEEMRSKDIDTQRTNIGIHKDDFIFEISALPVKKYGSQGQKKSFTVALKLAKYEVLDKETGEKPLILLDDIFDKLDDQRIESLLSIVSSKEFGQLFITDARIARTKQVLRQLAVEKKYIHVEQGVIVSEITEEV